MNVNSRQFAAGATSAVEIAATAEKSFSLESGYAVELWRERLQDLIRQVASRLQGLADQAVHVEILIKVGMKSDSI